MLNNDFLIVLNNNKSNKRLKIHSFHRYYGKLIPAIPETAINLFSKVNDIVFDPFSGSGTTGVESLKLKRNFIGIEINPLSCLISNAKLNCYDKNLLDKIYLFIDKELEKDLLIDESEIPWCINRDHWFELSVQKDLVQIKKAIDKVLSTIDKKEKQKYKYLLYAILSSIVKEVSYADNTHVFPGVSKRIKSLLANKQIYFNAKKTSFHFSKKE